MSHVDDMLHDWYLGVLGDEESARVEDHLASCVACREALDVHLALMSEAAGPATPPPADRLLADATALKRFERFTDRIAGLADVATDVARDWLSKIDDAAAWTDTALGDLQLFHIDGGPAVEDAIVGFVRLGPGADFPEHTHLGEEKIFVIQGALRDENDDVHGPGTFVRRDADTHHAISAEPGVPLVYLNIVHEGLEIFGMRFGPDSDEL